MARTISFTPDDIGRVRFGLSCLWEVLAGLRVLREPANHAVHLPWVRRTRPAVESSVPDLGLLMDLAGSGVWGDYAPDFLTPTPTTLEPSLTNELDQLGSTPPAVVLAQLEPLRGRWSRRLQRLAEDPATGLTRLAAAIRAYWDAAIQPIWPRLQTALDQEVFNRGRQQVAQGTATMLNDLHERVRWDGTRLTVAGTVCLGERHLDGGGLCLVPSAFVWPGVLVVADADTAQLAFPCRGVGDLWSDDFADMSGIDRLLGPSKTNLLRVLRTPTSVTSAASSVGLSVSTTSEHVAALRDAGLVRTTREGRTLLNIRTAVADALLRGAG